MCRQTRHLASAKSATGVAFGATEVFQIDLTRFLTDTAVEVVINSDNKIKALCSAS